MHQSTGTKIAHGSIQRRLGGKLWQAQLMPPIPAYLQRSEFGCSSLTKSRNPWPTITRAQRTSRLSTGVRIPEGWSSFAGAGPM